MFYIFYIIFIFFFFQLTLFYFLWIRPKCCKEKERRAATKVDKNYNIFIFFDNFLKIIE